MITVLICTTGGASVADVIRVFLQEKEIALEILVVIDNPEMDSHELETLAGQDNRLHLHRNERNLGLTKSLNVGLALSQGDIIVRNDDDDMPSRERLRHIRDRFATPEIDFAYSYATGRAESGTSTWSIRGPIRDVEIKRCLKKRNFIVASTVAYRRSRVIGIGGYNEAFRFAQDYELYLRSARNGLVFSCISHELVERRYSANSITVAKRKRQALFSFAARIMDVAETGSIPHAFGVIAKYAFILATPNVFRKIKRRLGHGK